MSQDTEHTNLLGLNLVDLERFFTQLGEKPFRARQVMQWIHQRGVTDFDQMTDISKSLREKLKAVAEVTVLDVTVDKLSSDGTRKWLFDLGDVTNAIECVYIPEKNRGTLCISSQVGCILNCSFCSTGHQGFNRNLSTAEIVSQVFLATHALLADEKTKDKNQPRKITNIVLMGMGEPLLNYDNVMSAIDILRDDFGYGIGKRRVTLSTAGVIPGIEKLRDRNDVSLALSLHAPNNELRSELVPLNKKYPIEPLMEACRLYVDGHARRKVTFEYVMLQGINDSKKHGEELVQLLKDMPVKVNLIPFNPFPGVNYICSKKQVIERFRSQLEDAGIIVTTRKTRGDDIDAACGQLVGNVKDKTRRSSRLLSMSSAMKEVASDKAI